MNEKGETVGKGNLKQQTQQVLTNIEEALETAGAKLENVVKWNVYILEGQDLREGFAAFTEKWGNKPNPPTLTGLFVSGLANPDWLVEMEAVVILPE